MHNLLKRGVVSRSRGVLRSKAGAVQDRCQGEEESSKQTFIVNLRRRLRRRRYVTDDD